MKSSVLYVYFYFLVNTNLMLSKRFNNITSQQQFGSFQYIDQVNTEYNTLCSL